jgi:hypothetical protein
MSNHECDTIHKVIAFGVGIVRLFLYLDNEGKEYTGGGDKRKGFAEAGELIQNCHGMMT